MKVLSVEDFEDFQCIGDRCPISCCAGGWDIMIDEKSYQYYQNVSGAFGDKLRENMQEKEKGHVFKQSNRACCFLDSSGLCEIYKNLGPDKLCTVCKTYPRFDYQAGDIYFRYLTLSCPEVTRRVFQRKELFQVDFAEGSGINPDDIEKDTDWEQFNQVIRAYTLGMNILQNRDLGVKDRLVLLMVFVYQFQNDMKQKIDPSGLIKAFSDKDIYISLLQDIPVHARNYESKIKAFQMIFDFVLRQTSYEHPISQHCTELAHFLNHNQLDSAQLDAAFQILATDGLENELEQLLAYRFFVVFMQGFAKQDYFERLALECVIYSAFLMYISFEVMLHGECSQKQRILYYSFCSRIQHSDGYLKQLSDQLVKENYYSLEEVLRLLS